MKTIISTNITLDENTHFHLYPNDAPNVSIMDKTGNIVRIYCAIDNLQKIDELISNLSDLKQKITKNTIAKLTSQQYNKLTLRNIYNCDF